MTESDVKADLRLYLQDARDALLWKLEGLSEYDIRRPMTVTGTNLLGLVKHLTGAEAAYFGETFGLDVLVSNAGTMAVSPFDELRQDDWDAMVATHITGLLNGIGAALPIFRQQRSGQFVNVASTAAYVVKSPQAVYAATKTAVKVLTEGLRQESGPELRVSLISPGFTNTEGVGKGASPEAAAAMIRQRDEIAMPPSAIASAIGYAIGQPDGVDVSEIVVRPTAQA